VYHLADDKEFEDYMNSIEDDIMTRFVPALKSFQASTGKQKPQKG